APFTKGCAEEQAALRHDLGISANAKIIGTVGRLDEIKRQDLLIRAVARLRERGQQVHLLLVGDGPRLEELKALAADLAAAAYVHFAGYQSQPERYLQLMDVFALTSRSEGMPLAVLEAWAAGVPVVASRVGGLPALIEEGQTGLLFPSGDEAALVETLATLLHDDELCRRLRKGGQERVMAEFTVERMAAAYQAHYREVLEQVGWDGSTRLLQPVGAGR
ncbi:MAG TPA: glycosyltransferase family 4 protein, partial [Gemmataceae bacterium]|nr:glycosyltransferase family 4 protein [Gemmataceae bacterium]